LQIIAGPWQFGILVVLEFGMSFVGGSEAISLLFEMEDILSAALEMLGEIISKAVSSKTISFKRFRTIRCI